MTPLIIATAKGNVDTMRVLLEYGAKVDVEDTDGRTPMICAITTQDYEKTLLLFQYGGNINTRTHENSMTSLMVAVSENRMELVRLCLLAGCNIHDEDRVRSLTPLP